MEQVKEFYIVFNVIFTLNKSLVFSVFYNCNFYNDAKESCDVEQNIVNTYTQEGMEDKTEKLQNNLHDSEKKDLNALIDNQVS